MLEFIVCDVDLEHAVKEDCEKCLIAQAIRRHVGRQAKVEVFDQGVSVDEQYFEHSEESERLMRLFDGGASLNLPVMLRLMPIEGLQVRGLLG